MISCQSQDFLLDSSNLAHLSWPFVELELGDQDFERRAIELGISDGIMVEILDGLTEKDKVKVWNITEPLKKKGEDEKDKKKKKKD